MRALVTGAGHPGGIGWAVAGRLREDGLEVVTHGWSDGEIPADFSDPAAPAAVIAQAGPLDVLVVCHATDSNVPLADVTADELDRVWAVNARAAVLLVQAFARQAQGGRVVLFTSGQHIGPMAEELPYAISKGAIHQMTRSLADAVADQGITVNTINPGPVDTGWPDDDLREQLRPRFPAGRWGAPEDIAGVVAFLVSADSAWLTGQVIDAEGGFRRG
jgi:3-oxoacyl-[acyl-carrier protein] reductase